MSTKYTLTFVLSFHISTSLLQQQSVIRLFIGHNFMSETGRMLRVSNWLVSVTTMIGHALLKCTANLEATSFPGSLIDRGNEVDLEVARISGTRKRTE